jgi:hypothetical protein
LRLSLHTYPRRYRIFTGLALLHLALMALGASYTGYSWSGPFERALDYYGELSGSGQTYGFFAPGIYTQLRAVFEVTDKSGQTRQVNLAVGENHEADLRVGNIIDQFSYEVEDPVEFQRSLSSSLAGTIFGRYPESRTVAVKLEEFHPVSMSEYRSGVRSRWESVYQAKYAVAKSEKTK